MAMDAPSRDAFPPDKSASFFGSGWQVFDREFGSDFRGWHTASGEDRSEIIQKTTDSLMNAFWLDKIEF